MVALPYRGEAIISVFCLRKRLPLALSDEVEELEKLEGCRRVEEELAVVGLQPDAELVASILLALEELEASPEGQVLLGLLVLRVVEHSRPDNHKLSLVPLPRQPATEILVSSSRFLEQSHAFHFLDGHFLALQELKERFPGARIGVVADFAESLHHECAEDQFCPEAQVILDDEFLDLVVALGNAA